MGGDDQLDTCICFAIALERDVAMVRPTIATSLSRAIACIWLGPYKLFGQIDKNWLTPLFALAFHKLQRNADCCDGRRNTSVRHFSVFDWG